MNGPVLAFCRVFLAVLAACWAILSPSGALAQDSVTIEVGKAVVLRAASDVLTVFVADSSIADATVDEGGQIFVNGNSPGETTLFATRSSGGQGQFTIIVTPNLTEVRRALSQRFPGVAISISAARGSILVAGSVPNEQQRERVIQTIEAAVPETIVIDQISVATSNLITLRVRLLEIDRSRAERFGIDWDATVASNGFFIGVDNGGIIRLAKSQDAVDGLNATLDVLSSSGIVAIAQESLLSTVEGQSAEFSVGGQIPIPTFIADGDQAEGGNYKLDYKFIGTNLKFTPVYAPGEKLRMEIESVISSADSGTTTVNGNTFPNLRSRSLKTSVELEDRQSFVIAGISRNETALNLRHARNGGGFSRGMDTLFGADRKSKQEQELVIVVTPLLRPTETRDAREGLPRLMSNLEFIVSGRNEGGKAGAGLPETIRKAGFQY
jgi:pilus assembly protein CpaC